MQACVCALRPLFPDALPSAIPPIGRVVGVTSSGKIDGPKEGLRRIDAAGTVSGYLNRLGTPGKRPAFSRIVNSRLPQSNGERCDSALKLLITQLLLRLHV